MRPHALCASALVLSAALASPAHAAVSLYVRAVDADGNQIQGDVTQKGYADAYSISSFGVGVSRTTGANGTSVLNFTPFATVGGVGAQSVNLFESVITGTPLRSVELDIVTLVSGVIRTQASWILTGAPVVGYSTAGDSTAGTLTEAVNYGFSDIRYTYFSYANGGSGTETFDYNLGDQTVTTTTTGTVSDFQFLSGTLPTSGLGTIGSITTPEPAALGVLALAGFGTLRRRTRRDRAA